MRTTDWTRVAISSSSLDDDQYLLGIVLIFSYQSISEQDSFQLFDYSNQPVSSLISFIFIIFFFFFFFQYMVSHDNDVVP